jgi:DNA-binding CsgD family transcriptional regulator
VVEAYRLTGREVQVARLVARGVSTDEIASTLFVSRHTVSDHLKAICEKVGVSSRGELASKLFADHDSPAQPQSRRAMRLDLDAAGVSGAVSCRSYCFGEFVDAGADRGFGHLRVAGSHAA